MMEFPISPLKGIGDIDFGMKPEEVRVRIRSDPKSFKRSPHSSFPCDYFESEGSFFYYDADGRLEAAEFAAPAQPTIENFSLLGLGLDVATAILSRLDPGVEREGDGAIAYQLGISIYAPLAKDDPSAPVESVLAFRSGYYD